MEEMIAKCSICGLIGRLSMFEASAMLLRLLLKVNFSFRAPSVQTDTHTAAPYRKVC